MGTRIMQRSPHPNNRGSNLQDLQGQQAVAGPSGVGHEHGVVYGGHGNVGQGQGESPSHSFGYSSTAASTIRAGNEAAKKEQVHRVVGLGVGLGSVVAEHILSHPCIVLRRQCQVHNDSDYYHLTPFTLFLPWFNVQRHQSVATLWKGLGSVLMTKGIGIASESLVSEFTPLPKEINKHSSIKKIFGHLVLKSIGCIIVTPFFASSLVETVQSEIASERPGVFDCLREGVTRLASLSTQHTTRLLPVWRLVLPTTVHGVMHYGISSMATYLVALSLRADLSDAKEEMHGEDPHTEKSLYEIYYPELIATFTGNLLADTLLFPLETVLHRLLLQGTRTIIDNTDSGLGVVPIITRYEGVTDCFISIIREEGVAGLYKGFGALTLQYGIHMALLRMTHWIFRRLSREMRHLQQAQGELQLPQTSPAQPSQIPRYYDARYPRSLNIQDQQ